MSLLQSISYGVGNISYHSLSVSFGLPTRLDASQSALSDADAHPQAPSKQYLEVPLCRLAYLNKPEIPVLLLGTIVAIINGSIQLIFSLLFSSAIKIFYEPPHELRKDSKFWALMLAVDISIIIQFSWDV